MRRTVEKVPKVIGYPLLDLLKSRLDVVQQSSTQVQTLSLVCILRQNQ